MNSATSAKYLVAAIAAATLLWVVASGTARADSPSNGCGPQSGFGSAISLTKIWFAEACNNHDNCYGDLRADKEACDEAFLQEALASCDEISLLYIARKRICEVTAYSFSVLVSRFGDDAWDAGQERARNAPLGIWINKEFSKILLVSRQESGGYLGILPDRGDRLFWMTFSHINPTVYGECIFLGSADISKLDPKSFPIRGNQFVEVLVNRNHLSLMWQDHDDAIQSVDFYRPGR